MSATDQYTDRMKVYGGFLQRLHHTVPLWVEPGALFHIRIRLDRDKQQRPLVDPSLAPVLLDSATFYEQNTRWLITLFVLMPDHVHAVLSFPARQIDERSHSRLETLSYADQHVMWQDGYFDHRRRPDERGTPFSAKLNYIRENPVAAGLCARPEDWPWIIDRLASNAGSACPQTDAT